MLGVLGREYSTILSTAEGESSEGQVSPYDYGRVGDTRPYQVVYPTYPAPTFLSQYAYLNNALRECDTLCQSYGVPFRTVKWGGKIPCMPCKQKINDNQLPSVKIYSKGALQGYPEATPVAESRPNGQHLIFAPDGSTRLAKRRDFFVRQGPLEGIVSPVNPQDLPAIPQTYMEAVQSAIWLAGNNYGKPTFVCSGFNQACKGRGGVPVVYVHPGAVVRRYPEELQANMFGAKTAEGSQIITTPVTPEMFQQLVALSQGGNLLPPYGGSGGDPTSPTPVSTYMPNTTVNPWWRSYT